MNDQFENRLSMYQKVQGDYVLNQLILDSIPAVTALHAEFNGYVNNILNIAGPASADLTGFAVDKQNSRTTLTMAILKISTAYAAWCYMENNINAAERFDDTMAMLNAKRDNDIYVYGKDLNTIASTEAANLSVYGVALSDFTDLETALADFLTKIQQPKIQIGNRASILSQMTKEFEFANFLLTNKLDKVMRIFLVTNPLVYESYLNARSIDDTGSSSAPDYSGTLTPGAVTSIANIPYLPSRSYQIKNNGGDFIHASLSNVETELQGTIMIIGAGETKKWLSSTLNPDPTANFFLMQNVGGMPANYEVRIEE